jgi:RHS repeat-associated protein
VGSFSATATSTFTVNGTNTVTDYYDGAGYVTNRVFGSGKTQALTWDGLGRLTGVDEMDTPTNGFVWTAVYDGLGRRLRTVQTPVVGGLTNSAAALTLDSYYDPLVEFQELAVGINGQRTWKVMGPDLDGHYGGMNGVGGLEATIRESDGGVTAVLNDIFGNVLATVSGTTASWNPVRVGGYGPVYGYQAATLTGGTPLAETLVWRSRRMDPSGFYDLGARYYDPVAGRFLSPDPLGNAGSMDLYSAFNGDPVNQFDPDGRFAAGSLNGALQYGSEVYASLGNALDAVEGVFHNDAYNAVYHPGGYQADSSYQYNYERGSDAYRAGSDFGYTAAFIGLQVGLVAATEGLGELAPVASGARWMEEADTLQMGGTMALQSGAEAETATSGGMADAAQYAKLKDYYSSLESASTQSGDFYTYYHGTSSEGAASIRQNGIDSSYFRAKNDFGAGFYVSKNRDVALLRARQSFGNDVQVLEYRIPKSDFDNLNHLEFNGPSDVWANFVRTQRQQLSGSGHSYDVISGPMWRNLTEDTGFPFGPDGRTVANWPWPSESQMSIHSYKAIQLFNSGLQ